MSPKLILEQAVQKKINLISITDHNTVQHSIIAFKQSKNMSLTVIPGVELTSREEVHVLAYFSDVSALLKVEKIIESSLTKAKNNPKFFGYQLYYDQNGEIVGIDDVLRQAALNIGLDDLVDSIHDLGGIAIPAHIDKNRFSLLRQLGFIDKLAKFDAVEVSKSKWRKDNFSLGNILSSFPVIAGSDSHVIEDIGLFFMEDKNGEIRDFPSLKKFLERSRQ